MKLKTKLQKRMYRMTLLDHNTFMFNIFGVTGTSEHLTK